MFGREREALKLWEIVKIKGAHYCSLCAHFFFILRRPAMAAGDNVKIIRQLHTLRILFTFNNTRNAK